MKTKIATVTILAAVLLIPALVMRSDCPDWPAFYVGAKLVGTSQLYSFDASQAITREFAWKEGVWAFLRPPFYAAILYPLGKLEPQQAFVVWQVIGAIGFAVAVWMLWPSPFAAALAVIFHPVWTAFRQGQDIWVVLLICATTIKLLKQDKPFAAGIVFSLCVIKPHLLLLVPIVVLVKRMWAFGEGVFGGGLTLVMISTIIQGASIDWIREFIVYVRENERHISAQANTSPSSFLSIVHPIVAVAVVIVACCFLSKKLEASTAIAVAVSMGLLIAPRMYSYDLIVVLPVLMIFFRQRYTRRQSVKREEAADPIVCEDEMERLRRLA